MSNHPPHAHDSKKPGDETPRPPTSDEQLKSFWLKNEKSIYVACLVVIIVVAGAGIFRNMRKAGQDQIGVDYAAANTPEKLRAFISANPGHVLASAAELRLADEAYQARRYVEAAAAYDKAAANKTTPYASRALVGAAMSKILGGQTADGENRLRQIANDTMQPAVIRAEATYHLASLAASAGQTADAIKLFGEVSAIAPSSMWAENAAYQSDRLSVGANTTVTAQPSEPSSVPSIQFP